MKDKTRQLRGFTILDLLFILAIIALLGAFIIPLAAHGETVTRQGSALPPMELTRLQQPGATVIPPTPTNAPPTPGNFLQTAIGYFSATSDLQTFQTNDTFDVWTGAEYVNNLNTAATLGISWNVWKQATADPIGLGIETQTRNAGVAGTILAQGFGFNVQKAYKDIKLEGFVEGEKNFVLDKYMVEIGFRLFKALTDNTFGGFGASEFVGGGNTSKVPNVIVFLGAKI